MTATSSPRFQSILEAARNRTSQGEAETMVVSGHLAQQRMFMVRQGVEFYPKQDTFGHRKTFLQALVRENEVDSRLEGVVDDFLLDGKGLWFFRPVGDSYRIMWFPKSQYRAYYDALEELEEIHLIYLYKVKPGMGMMAAPGGSGTQEKWVKLVVRRDVIVETLMMSRPQLDGITLGGQEGFGRTRTVRNSLGFIPAVEAFNNMKSTGKDATGEFDWMESQIITHDEMVSNIRENLRFFANPTLVSSRPKSDIVEPANSSAITRPTISSQAGFSGEGRPSTRVSAPTGSGSSRGGYKIPRMIANLEPNDRVGYITPDAVSGDHNLYARQYREELRTALGGVDELGITSGATAYEIKSLFGRAAATAARKCRGLITYGLCKLFDLIIYNEERVFRESFALAIKLKRPEAPLQEQQPDPKKFRKEAEAFDAAMAAYDAKLEAKIRQAIEAQQLPPGVMGLIPDGDRQVDWRWRGPVFEDSTEDILNKSIVVRNLQELGVASVEALRHLFPDKTDEERSAMLSGFPFRMAQQTQSSIATFLSLVAQMQQTPHPQAPNVPLLADPRLDLTPYLYRALDFLKRELTYAGTYRDSSGSGDPAGLNAFERSRLERGLPASSGGSPATFVPDPAGPWATGGLPGAPTPGALPGAPGPGGQSLGAGAPGPLRLYERDAQLPAPGATIATDPLGDAWLSGRAPGLLPSFSGGGDGASGPVPAAGLLAGRVPATAAARAPGAGTGSAGRRRVPGKPQ
jgi:hypothetical protein